MPASEKERILTSVRELGRRVTVADVSSATGLPVSLVTRQLNEIAGETKGTLQVSDEGTIVYCFHPAFASAYLTRGIAAIFKTTARAIFELAYYLLKVSFGIVLIASLLTVVILICIAVIAILKAADGGGGGEGGDFNFDWLDASDLLAFFSWDFTPATCRSEPSLPAGYGYYSDPQAGPKQGFLMNCYSYLFGDGNPNSGIEEYKWQLIAEGIRQNHGVMTSEQLAPYSGANPKDDYAVFPVLVRFDGRPEVSETGNIVYVFPAMSQTASPGEKPALPLPAYLKEKEWKFSRQPFEDLCPVMIFAFLNFAGSFWLWRHMESIYALHPFTLIIRILTIYGVFFISFPIFRVLGLAVVNGMIDARNKMRESFSLLVAQPSHALKRKLEEARSFRIADKRIAAEQIAYSTDRDLLDQEFER